MKPQTMPKMPLTIVVRFASVAVIAGALGVAAIPQALGQPQSQAQGEATQGEPMPGWGTMGGGMRGGMMGGMMGGGMMGGGGMMRMMGHCPMMGGDGTMHVEGRIAFLKAELGITDQQKAAFDAYAAALKKNLEGMQAMRATMMKMMQAKTPVERLDAHVNAMETRVAALKELKPALTDLYASLSEAQKQKAAELLTGMGCMMM